MKKILGKCKCGELVTKFIDCSHTPRTDGTNYKPTNEENSKWSMFRCKKCSAVIEDSWEEIK